MEYRSIERPAGAFQQPVPPEQIQAICQRAFGADIQLESAQELSGGLYNNTYLIRIQGLQPMILRVGPHFSRRSRHERNYMYNEYLSLPYLAALTPLLPRIIMADFTRQILDRDYLIQSFIEGELWSEVIDKMTADENRQIWRQLGSITRTIHDVEGPVFGSLANGPQYSSWSSAILTGLEKMADDLAEAELYADDLRTISELAQARTGWLDEITSPRLLHGDLWTVNLLVKREASGARIVGVLDSDRTSWGDPQADWTMFLLAHKPPIEATAFWETYGQPAYNLSAQFRKLIYRASALGNIRMEQYRLQQPQGVERTIADMQARIMDLSSLLATTEPQSLEPPSKPH